MSGLGHGSGRGRPTALGLSGAFVALAFGGWCTVHGILSAASAGPGTARAAASAATSASATNPPPPAGATTPVRPAASGGKFLRRTPAPPAPVTTPAPATPRPSPVPLTPQQLFDRTVPAVVRVNVFDATMQSRSHGSGFFVGGGGLVITNFHVIRNANFATVETSEGSTLFVEGVAAENEAADLALLKVATGVQGAASPAAMPTVPLGGDAPPPVGTKVYAIGHPRGLRNVLSEGLISGHGEGAEGSGLPSLQTTTPMSPGSSGGPLLTADGSVVGVSTAGLSDSQNLNFAVPVSQVHELLDAFQRGPAAVRKLGSAGVKPIDPEGSKAIQRIIALARQDRMREAVELAESLNARYGDNPYYWSAVGFMHLKLKNHDLAVESYERALKLKPDFASAHVNLGTVYLDQQKYEEAVHQYELAAKLTPDDPVPYYNAGFTYGRAGKPEKAVPFFKFAIGLKPDYWDAHLWLAQAYLDQKQYDAARASVQAAIKLQPANANGHTKLGEVFRAMKRLDEAKASLQKAISLRPQHAEAYVSLGALYLEQKDYAAAAAAWKNAVRFDGNGRWGNLARKGLAGLPPGYSK